MDTDLNSAQVTNLAVTTVFGVLSLLAVCCRIISRRLQRLKLLASDYFMILGRKFVLAGLVSNDVAIFDGFLGEHQNELSTPHTLVYLKSIFGLQLFWAAAEGAVKTSMCLLYIQLFPQRHFRIAAWATLLFCNAFALTVILATVLICEPVAFNFDPTIPGTCGNRVGMWVGIGVLNIITDLCVVFLPVTVLWMLKLKTSKKVGLYIIFSLGLFVSIISGIRLKFLLDIDFAGDASYEIVTANIWSLLEPTTAISFGCMPTMKPLYDQIRGKRGRVSQIRSSRMPSYAKSFTQGYSRGTTTSSDRAPFERLHGDNQIPLTETSVCATTRPNKASDEPHSSNDVLPLQGAGIETTQHIEVHWT